MTQPSPAALALAKQIYNAYFAYWPSDGDEELILAALIDAAFPPITDDKLRELVERLKEPIATQYNNEPLYSGLQMEAASALTSLSARVAELRVANSELEGHRDAAKIIAKADDQDKYNLLERAEKAEARVERLRVRTEKLADAAGKFANDMAMDSLDKANDSYNSIMNEIMYAREALKD